MVPNQKHKNGQLHLSITQASKQLAVWAKGMKNLDIGGAYTVEGSQTENKFLLWTS